MRFLYLVIMIFFLEDCAGLDLVAVMAVWIHGI